MKIDAKTYLYGVIGDPVSHSLSPIMHNPAFSSIGHNGVYLAFGVKDLKSAIAGVRGLNVKGLSVTIPHKVTIMEYLDEIDEKALKIGAVNTVVNRDGKLFGSNTDCMGATEALLAKTTLKDKKVLLIGAGGAARAIGYGVMEQGAHLTIINILEDEGQKLAADLGVDYYHLSEFARFDYDVLINSTPVGMSPNIDAMPVAREDLKAHKVVMDIIYNPLQTQLLKTASQKDCLTIGGVEMFVHQGACQFELWTGSKAPFELMKKNVLEALTR